MLSDRMKTLLKIFAMLLTAVLLTSCGTAGKGVRSDRSETSPADTTEKRDTFVPLHPPVIVPHTWRDAQ